MNTDNLRTSISIKIDTSGPAFTDCQGAPQYAPGVTVPGFQMLLEQDPPQYAPGAEVARILRDSADRIEREDATGQLPLIDYYGNHVGLYEHHATPIQ